MNNIDAICFDAFGTLLHFAGKRVNPYRHLTNVADKRLPLLTLNENIDYFAQQLGLDHLVPIMRRELENEISGLALYDDVEAVIKQLRAHNKKIAVCSNLAAEYGDAVKAMLPGMNAYIFSFEVGEKKPSPVIYQSVCEALGSKPGRILFVGDSKRCDFNGPAQYGMKSIWLRRSEGQSLSMALLSSPGNL